MTKTVMTSIAQTMTCFDHIRELTLSMDRVELAPDGYSSDDEDDDDNELNEDKVDQFKPLPDEYIEQQVLFPSFKPNNKYLERRQVMNKVQASPRHIQMIAKSTLHKRKETKTHGISDHKISSNVQNDDNTDNASHVNETDMELPDIVDGAIECKHEMTYTDEELMPIIRGQRKEDEHVPIMSLPALPDKPKFQFGIPGQNAPPFPVYAKSMTFRFLTAGDGINCTFKPEKTQKEHLVALLDCEILPECFCVTSNLVNEELGGWVNTQKVNKTKLDKRRKSLKPNLEGAYNRFTQTLGKDPVMFNHYKDWKKYIERYRFYHTVGKVGRPASYNRYSDVSSDSDNYYSKMKSSFRAMIGPPSLSNDTLPSKHTDKYAESTSSTDSGCDKQNVDDDDRTEPAASKLYSVRDRGKALNLAPVRECTVPDLRASDKIDIVQLNKYLNLTTPPSTNTVLHFEMEDGVVKKVGNRILNTGDNYLFPACSPRRGARPLRLGSAEIVKPGTAESEVRASLQRSATFSPAPATPGNLIVGSTVTSRSPKPRVKSGTKRKVSAYIQFQKELFQHKNKLSRPQTPPRQVSGQRCTPCERVTEITSAPLKGRLAYTNGQIDDNKTTDSGKHFDLQEAYMAREREKKMNIDVNHLGIRGTTFKQSEGLVVYRNRRTATAKT